MKSVSSAGFSSDGYFIVTSQDATGSVWNAHSGASLGILKGHTRSVSFAGYAPDNEHVVTASADRTARLWDTRVNGSLITLGEQLKEISGTGSKGTVSSATFSLDGETVVTAHDDGYLRLWSANSGKLRGSLNASEPVYLSVFSPDGSRILGSTETHTLLWDAHTKRLITTLDGTMRSRRDRLPEGSNFSPRGDRFVTSSKEKWSVWDTHSGKLVCDGYAHDPDSATFSPDGQHVAVVSGNDVSIFGTQSDHSVTPVHNGRYDNFAVFSSDGRRIATAFSTVEGHPSPPNPDRAVNIWDTQTGKLVAILQGHQDYVISAAFSPDGSRLITASNDHTARIWDLASAKTLLTLDQSAPARYAAFSPDGAQIIILSGDSEATLWEALTGHRLAMLQGHIGSIYSVAFAPDGSRIVTAGQDGTAKVYSAAVPSLVEEYLSTAFRLLRQQPREYEQVRPLEPYLPLYLKALQSMKSSPLPALTPPRGVTVPEMSPKNRP